jgi:hypothetical protein
MEKVNVVLSVVMIPFLCLGCGECMVNQLDLDFWLWTNEGTQISNIIRKGKICGLRTNETCHGWQ